MCLAIPGKLVAIRDTRDSVFRVGDVVFSGIRQEVNLMLVPEARQGDYVLVHVGVAISIVDPLEAQATLDLMSTADVSDQQRKKGDAEELNDSANSFPKSKPSTT